MFKFSTDNIIDRINNKTMKRYQLSVDQIMSKANLKLLDGSDMMG
jgi:hypothetical protein